MSSAMDKALMALCLDEVDEPFIMPLLPEFCSSGKNAISLIGRILNPKCQKIPNLIRDLPRKWQKTGRVRGVMLTQEKFQFIFNSKYDLDEIYDKGVHTYNEWALVMEHWKESPPKDYLQFITVWVQIRFLPVNYYTVAAITAIGELLGQVLEVAYDPERAQTTDYVRVKIRFDVSKALRKSKIISLPNGEQSEVFFHYERIQKRCFHCQRLIHDKESCPLLTHQRFQQSSVSQHSGIRQSSFSPKPILLPDDPLFGVLNESQVGLMNNSGRLKIANEVMDEMRIYMLAATDSDRNVRIARVRKSIKDLENDPLAQKMILRLEPLPLVSKDMDKGKGHLFDYDVHKSDTQELTAESKSPKFMAAAIKANSSPHNIYRQSTPAVPDSEFSMAASIPVSAPVVPFHPKRRDGLSLLTAFKSEGPIRFLHHSKPFKRRASSQITSRAKKKTFRVPISTLPTVSGSDADSTHSVESIKAEAVPSGGLPGPQ